MNKATKWLVGLVAVLVIANIALAASIWLKKENRVTNLPSQPKGDARDYLVKELSLNETQVNAFDSLRKGHFERIKGYQEEMRHAKDDFFNGLRQPHNAQTDSLAQHIGVLQTKIDLETFDHFAALRSLLNRDQKEKFDNTIQEVLHTMSPRNGPPDRRMGPPPEGEPPHDGPPPHS